MNELSTIYTGDIKNNYIATIKSIEKEAKRLYWIDFGKYRTIRIVR